jgi:nitric oxide dioxygenase
MKPLFRQDRDVQAYTFLDNIEFLIKCVKDFEGMIPKIKRLGIKHKGYGTKKQHYPKIKSALLNTLEKYFHDEITEEVKSAWEQIYDKTAEYMILGAQRK